MQLSNNSEDFVKEKHEIANAITASELLAADFGPIKWVVPGLIPEGLTVLAGDPKSGKSWMCLDLCRAVAGDGEFLGEKVTSGEVLYLALEDSKRRLRKRLLTIPGGHEPTDRLAFFLEWDRMNEGGAVRLTEWLEANPETRLVVIDTLQCVRKLSNGKGVYQDDYGALRELKRIADSLEVPIVVVHHLNQGDAQDPFRRVSGSAGITGAADTIMVLDRDRASRDAVLYVTGRDVDDKKRSLRLDETMRWQNLGDHVNVPRHAARLEILNALSELGSGWHSPKDVTDLLGGGDKKYESVKKLLRKMAENGEVQYSREIGRYAAPPDYQGQTAQGPRGEVKPEYH